MEGVDDVLLHFQNVQFSFQRSTRIVNVVYIYNIHVYLRSKEVSETPEVQNDVISQSLFYMDTSPPVLCLAPMSPENFTFF